MAPEIDTSRLPLIVVRIDGPPTDEEHASYLGQLAAIAKRHRPHACIVHARDEGGLSRQQGQRQAQWIDQHRAMLSANCVGTAFVFPSAVQRFMLSTILMMSRMPMPYRVCATVEEAERWASSQLR